MAFEWEELIKFWLISFFYYILLTVLTKQLMKKWIINYWSSSILEFRLNSFLSFFFIFLLNNFLVVIHYLGWSCTWHSPSVWWVTSFLYGFSICSVISCHSFSMVGIVCFVLCVIILFIDTAHSMNPIHSVLFFPLTHSVSLFRIVAFNFFTCFKSNGL